MSHRTLRGLLDTNAVILLPRLERPTCLPEEPLISAITLAELSVGPLVTDDPSERATRQANLQLAESSFEAIPFDAAAARTFGRVAAALRTSGRKHKARAYDALIASVAITHHLPLFTANPGDFEGIEELEVIPIAHPDS